MRASPLLVIAAQFALGCSSGPKDDSGPPLSDATLDTGLAGDGASADGSPGTPDAFDATPQPCLGAFDAPRIFPYTRPATEDELGIAVVGSDDEAIYLIHSMLGGVTDLLRMEKSDSRITQLMHQVYNTMTVQLDGDSLIVWLESRSGSIGSVVRMSKDGVSSTILAKDVGIACGTAHVGDRLYIALGCTGGGGGVRWTAIAGGDTLHDFSPVNAWQIVADGTGFYASTIREPGGDIVHLKDDGTFDVLAHVGADADWPILFGIDDEAVYLYTTGYEAAGARPERPAYLYRVAKTGGEVATLATRPKFGIKEPQLDCSGVFFREEAGGSSVLKRTPKAGGDLETLFSFDVDGFALDAHELVTLTDTAAAQVLRGSARR